MSVCFSVKEQKCSNVLKVENPTEKYLENIKYTYGHSWSDTTWNVLTLQPITLRFIWLISSEYCIRPENKIKHVNNTKCFVLGQVLDETKNLNTLFRSYATGFRTTEASAGACWSPKRRNSSPFAVTTSCCWLNHSACRSAQADALVTWRMTNAVCQHLYHRKCMHWHTASHTHTASQTHTHTSRTLSWDSDCPRDQTNVDNYSRGSSRAPQVFHGGVQGPGCCASLNDTVMSEWSGEVCLILITNCLMWLSGTSASWNILMLLNLTVKPNIKLAE